MSRFYLQIGSTDITSYIKTDGFEWERNDIDVSGSGRDNNGTMRRTILTVKEKMNIACRSLTDNELSTLCNLLSGAMVSVTYWHVGLQAQRTANFYNSSISSGVSQDTGDEILNTNVKFSLIEV